jgi:hypothetical protein
MQSDSGKVTCKCFVMQQVGKNFALAFPSAFTGGDRTPRCSLVTGKKNAQKPDIQPNAGRTEGLWTAKYSYNPRDAKFLLKEWHPWKIFTIRRYQELSLDDN